MSENHDGARSLNPFVFLLQKLGTELKCLRCLNLVDKPVLLPCDHIFCSSCAVKSPYQCLTCQYQFSDHEIWPSSYLGNIVTIYKTMESTFNSTIYPLLSADSGVTTPVSTPRSQLRKKLSEERPDTDAFPAKYAGSQIESEELDVNHVSKVSPLSIHSSDDVQDEDCFIIEPVRQNGRTESETSKKSVGGTVPDGVDDENVSQTREPKRQKKLNNRSSERVLQSHRCKFKEDTVCQSFNDENVSQTSACAFCHSTEITKWTGPLLHFAGGKEVARGDTNFPSATPVHRQCLNWSPQIYYVGDEIQNLETELMRASGLKCNKCGLKGASLGCFVESCQRSYHMPCAVETADCRWDCEEYLMLCPRHEKSKFPNEKSNSGKCNKLGECSMSNESASKCS